MRIRLLDMGHVTAVRSQSIYHAVASGMGPEDDPVVVISGSQTSFVSIGIDQRINERIDLQYCQDQALPIILRHTTGGLLLIDENHLLYAVILPKARVEELGWPSPSAERSEHLNSVLAAAFGLLGASDALRLVTRIDFQGATIGGNGAAEIGDAFFFAASLIHTLDRERTSRAIRLQDPSMRSDLVAALGTLTTLRGELDPAPELAAVGEALAGALESILGIELIPSMPTPDELDAIYEWDLRLTSPDLLRHIPKRDSSQGLE